jgi:hypothetical protein
MDVLGSIITAGVAIMAIAMIAMVTGQTLTALPAFDAGSPWADTMTAVNTNAGTAFDLLGITPLVLAAAVIIAIIIGAFVFK